MDNDSINIILAVLAALGGLGEALSLIPSIKSNGVVQLVIAIGKKVAGK